MTLEEIEKNSEHWYNKYKEKAKMLEQAKEIIRTFLNMPMPNNEEVFADVGAFLTEAEQFIGDAE